MMPPSFSFRGLRVRQWASRLAICLVLGCGEVDEALTADASQADANRAECTVPNDCSDDLYCNGDESCEDGVCVSGHPPCAQDICDEAGNSCPDCRDLDGDGSRDVACGGQDCNDTNPRINPSMEEVCDAEGLDEDCNPTTFGNRDQDGDGMVDWRCCNQDNCGTDCDDSTALRSPLNNEDCDHIDNDCDGDVDEGLTFPVYTDADGDGFGDPTTMRMVCFFGEGETVYDTDCDDSDPTISPIAREACDSGGADENCDGEINPSSICGLCSSGETRRCQLPGICGGTGNQECVGDAWSPVCSVRPSTETCNHADDDCDGLVDEGLTVICFPDADDDGFAIIGSAESHCPDPTREDRGRCPMGYTGRVPDAPRTRDCRESMSEINPAEPEHCDNELDDDCDRRIDEVDCL